MEDSMTIKSNNRIGRIKRNSCLAGYWRAAASAVLCFLLQANLISAAEGTLEQKSLQPSGRHLCKTNSGNMLLLSENGKACAEIVCARYSPVVAFAARELKAFLDQATGADFKIVPKRTGGLPAIFVGDSPWTRAWGVDVNALARDGFIIRRVKDAIVIAGKDDPWINPEKDGGYLYERGTIFGVYDFLERFVGVRFYFPGEIGTVVPKYSILRVPAMDILEEPDFSIRSVQYGYGGPSRWFFECDAGEHQRLVRQEVLRLRGQTQYIPNCHGMSRLGYLERFGGTHPEFFVLYPDGKRGNDSSRPGHPGQLCYSNTNLEDEVYKDAEAYLMNKPASFRKMRIKRYQSASNPDGALWSGSAFRPGYFNAMPQDGLEPCQCPQCKPFYENKRAGDLIWGFVCRLAQRLKKNGVPGYVTSMAYPPYLDVPDLEIPDNVLVMVATMGPWSEKYPALQEKEDKLIRDWSAKLKHKVWLWNYINDHAGRVPSGVPPLSTKWIADYYKRNAPYLTGAFIESENEHFIFQYLNYYVFMKVAWDTSTDREELMAEHNRKLFGPAAEPMGRFFARLEELWTVELIGEFKNTSLGPTFVAPSALKTWEKVFNAERMNELGKIFDEAEKLAASDADSLKRVKFFREKLFGEIIKARKKYAKTKREIEDLVFEVTPLPEGQAIVVDGILNEPAWTNAPEIFLVNAEENEPALVKTRVRALWTEKSLYLGFECDEPKTDDIAVIDRKRDDQDIWKDSSVEIFLNPSNDRANYFQLMVNAKGNMADLAWRAENEAKIPDWKWNINAESAARIEKGAWIVEIAIPLKDINPEGIEAGAEMIANFNRSRYVRNGKPEENQLYTWSPFVNKTTGFHRLDRFGRLRFVREKTKNVSLIKNGSFEDVRLNPGLVGLPADWYFSQDEKERKAFTLDEDFCRDGIRSLKIESDEPVKTSASQWFSGMKPATRYIVTFYVKTKDVLAAKPGGGAYVNIWHGKWQNLFFPQSGYLDTLPWSKQGFAFTTGQEIGDQSKGSKPYIRVHLLGASGTVWFDDVRVREDKNDG